MRFSRFLSPLALLVTGLTLGAQAPDLAFGVKYTVGANVNDTNKLYDSRAMIGYAFHVEMKLNDALSLYAEPNYRTFRSVMIETTQFGPGYLPNSGAAMTITPTNSFVGTLNVLESYGLNLGVRKHINADLSVHGALGLNSVVSRQEVLGNINYTTSAAPAIGANTEHIAVTPTKRALYLGLSGGARYMMSDNAYLEANVNYMPYKMANWVPYAYTGQEAHMETISKSKLTTELSLGIRF